MPPKHKKINSQLIICTQQATNPVSQDWICLNCNNLNYSFRSKCNRCKVQTREDNRKELYADYYYYTQYYPYNNTQPPAQMSHSQHCFPCLETHQSPQKKPMSEGWLIQQEDDHLPSVSPLVKRYRAQKLRNKKEENTFGWKLVECQPLNEIPIIDLSCLIKNLGLTDDEEASYEFAKNVEKMII